MIFFLSYNMVTDFYLLDVHLCNRNLLPQEAALYRGSAPPNVAPVLTNTLTAYTSPRQNSQENDNEFSSVYDSDCETGYKNNYKVHARRKPGSGNGGYKKRIVICAFGKIKVNNLWLNVAVHLVGYKPSFYARIPEDITDDKYLFLLKNRIQACGVTSKYGNVFCAYEVVHGRSFINYSNSDSRFIRISFNNMSVYNKVYHKLKRMEAAGRPIELFEPDLMPIIKFIHDLDSPPVGWRRIRESRIVNIPIDYKFTDCEYEVSVHWSDLIESSGISDTLMPQVNKCAWDIECAPLVSNKIHPLADRGDPVTHVSASWTIGSSFQECTKLYNLVFHLGKSIPQEEYPGHLGELKDRVVNLVAISCRNEEDLILKFVECLRRGPIDYYPDLLEIATQNGCLFPVDALYTYNGNAFDEKYMLTRAESLMIDHIWRKTSKYRDFICPIVSTNLVRQGRTVNTKFLSRPGVANIDLFKHVESLNNTAIVDMKLKTVSKFFLNERVNRSEWDIMSLYKIIIEEDSSVAEKYASVSQIREIREELGADRIAALKESRLRFVEGTHAIYEAIERVKVQYSDTKYDLDYQELYNICCKSVFNIGIPRENELAMFETIKYAIYDSILLHKLESKFNVLLGKIAQSKITHFPMPLLMYRGNSVVLSSLAARKMHKKIRLSDNQKENCGDATHIKYVGYLLPLKDREERYKVLFGKFREARELEKEKYLQLKQIYPNIRSPGKTETDKENLKWLKWYEKVTGYIEIVYDNWPKLFAYGDLDDEKLSKAMKKLKSECKNKGAFVVQPQVGSYKNVATLDVASEYPSTIIQFGLSHELAIPETETNVSPYETYIWENVTGEKYPIRMYKGQIGVIPELLLELLAARKAKKREMAKYAKGSIEYLVIDCEQLAIKLVCNSQYGIMNDINSPLYFQALAACTTALAREYLITCAAKVNEFYPNSRLVYGDTDSIFINYNVDTLRETWEIAADCETRINEYMASIGRPHMIIELEKVYSPLWLFSKKKKYFGWKYENPDGRGGELNIMGIKAKKRDSTKIEKYSDAVTRSLFLNFPAERFRILEFFRELREYSSQLPQEYYTIRASFKGIDAYDRTKMNKQIKLYDLYANSGTGKILQGGDYIYYLQTLEEPYINDSGKVTVPKANDCICPADLMEVYKKKIDYSKYVNTCIKTQAELIQHIIRESDNEINYVDYFS